MPRRHEINSQIIFTVMFGLLLAIFLGRMMARFNPSTDATLVFTIGIILALPLVWRLAHGRLDPFEPIVIFAVVYGVMFVVRPAALLKSDSHYVTYWRPWIDISPTFTLMVGLALVGAAAFVSGYELPLGQKLVRRLKGPPADFHTDMVAMIAVAIGVVGLLLQGYFLWSTGASIYASFRDPDQLGLYKNSSAYFYMGAWLLVPTAVVLMGVGRVRSNRSILTLGLVFAATSLVLTLVGGSRFQVLPLVSGILLFHYMRRQARARMSVVLCLVLFALFASALVLNYRIPQVRQGSGIAEMSVLILTEPSRMIEPLTEGLDNGMADLFAAALTVHPENLPFNYGRSAFIDLFFRPVPRTFWEEKPLPPVHQTAEELWPENFARGLVNPEFSILLAFYRELGAPGISVGMFGAGVLARAWFEYLLAHRHNVAVQLTYAIAFPFFIVGFRDNPVDNIWRAAAIVFPVWLAFFIAGRKSEIEPGD